MSKGKITLLVIAGFAAGVALTVVSVFIYANIQDNVEPTGLLKATDSMPKHGTGDFFATHKLVDEDSINVFHWGESESIQLNRDPEVWLDEMEQWCASRQKIVDRADYETSGGFVRGLNYKSPGINGSLFCFASRPVEGKPMECIAVIFEHP